MRTMRTTLAVLLVLVVAGNMSLTRGMSPVSIPVIIDETGENIEHTFEDIGLRNRDITVEITPRLLGFTDVVVNAEPEQGVSLGESTSVEISTTTTPLDMELHLEVSVTEGATVHVERDVMCTYQLQLPAHKSTGYIAIAVISLASYGIPGDITIYAKLDVITSSIVDLAVEGGSPHDLAITFTEDAMTSSQVLVMESPTGSKILVYQATVLLTGTLQIKVDFRLTGTDKALLEHEFPPYDLRKFSGTTSTSVDLLIIETLPPETTSAETTTPETTTKVTPIMTTTPAEETTTPETVPELHGGGGVLALLALPVLLLAKRRK